MDKIFWEKEWFKTWEKLAKRDYHSYISDFNYNDVNRATDTIDHYKFEQSGNLIEKKC